MKIIAIEGVDGCGKQTQSKMLFDALSKTMDVDLISFPNYESDSSSLVKMYLNGEISNNPMDINAYAASSFYAVDRYITYKKEIEKKMKTTGCFIMDRYTPSNIIYQAAKVKGKEREACIKWIEDYEYEKLGLPRPDITIFLDMPVWASQQISKMRKNKITGESKMDIHEASSKILNGAYENAMDIAKKCNYVVISCIAEDGKTILTPKEIHSKILETVMKS